MLVPAFGVALCAQPQLARADAMAGPTIECKTASVAMTKASPSPSAMKANETLDQQFVDAMMANSKMVAAMAHIESQCGKDAKVRATAQKMTESAQMEQDQLKELTEHAGG